MLDTLKAFLSGLLTQQVAKIKKKSREWEENIRKEVIESERQNVADPTPEKQGIWLKKQECKVAITRKAENKRLCQRQNSFGEGEKKKKWAVCWHFWLKPIAPQLFPRLGHQAVKSRLSLL